jgi:uracil-DNA glycosylase family 4
MIGRLREQVAICELCNLHKTRVNPVFDKGNPNAVLMICGMVPARDENEQGTPFVGRAGKLLDTILVAAGLTYDDVYITNLVKCFVAAGQSLEKSWVESCRPYLAEQIRIIKPIVIITLGADSSRSLCDLAGNIPMYKMRGRALYHSKETMIVPTYHPSYLLRKGGIESDAYKEVMKDFELAKKCLKEMVNMAIYT